MLPTLTAAMNTTGSANSQNKSPLFTQLSDQVSFIKIVLSHLASMIISGHFSYRAGLQHTLHVNFSSHNIHPMSKPTCPAQGSWLGLGTGSQRCIMTASMLLAQFINMNAGLQVTLYNVL